MQEVFNDGSLGEIQEIDLRSKQEIERLEKLLQKQEVKHINLFNKQSKYEGEKADPEKRIELSENELEEKIKKVIKEEKQKEDILNTYEKIKKNT